MGDGHTFQQDSFGGGLGLPLGFEDIPELLVGGFVFVDEDDVARAESEGEGVEADGGLAFRGDRAGGVLRVLAVGLVLFAGNQHELFLAGLDLGMG